MSLHILHCSILSVPIVMSSLFLTFCRLLLILSGRQSGMNRRLYIRKTQHIHLTPCTNSGTTWLSREEGLLETPQNLPSSCAAPIEKLLFQAGLSSCCCQRVKAPLPRLCRLPEYPSRSF